MNSHAGALAYAWFIFTLTAWWPDAPVFMRWRGRLLALAMPEAGPNFQVSARAIIRGLDRLRVGRDVYLAANAVILCGLDIRLGDGVMVACGAVITDGNHTCQDGSYRFGPRKQATVTIGNGTWVCANCTIVAGVHIGACVLVGANSVVSHDLPDGVFAAGVPAVVVRAATLRTGTGQGLRERKHPGS